MRLKSEFLTALHRLDDHWIGDLIGAISLFGWGYVMFFFAGVMQ